MQLNWKHGVVVAIILGVLILWYVNKNSVDSTNIRKIILANDVVKFKAEISKLKTTKDYDMLADDYKSKNGSQMVEDVLAKMGQPVLDWLTNYNNNLS